MLLRIYVLFSLLPTLERLSEWSQMALSCPRAESSCLWKASSKGLLSPLAFIFNGCVKLLDTPLKNENDYPGVLW